MDKVHSTTRFSDRVDNYIKYRPGYPLEIIDLLVRDFRLNKNRLVADIGSGTGILTKIFLDYGNEVYGVEPNDAMRHAAEQLLKGYPHFKSVKGRAEQTGLSDDSVDMIIAGQAFHWFDPEKTKVEFQRIAREKALVTLIWNERRTSSSFGEEYEKLIAKYATDYSTVNHKNIKEKNIADFFAPHSFAHKVFYNEQVFDLNGLRGRLLSSSYIPNEKNSLYGEMDAELSGLFQRYQASGTITIEYDTKLYIGKIK